MGFQIDRSKARSRRSVKKFVGGAAALVLGGMTAAPALASPPPPPPAVTPANNQYFDWFVNNTADYVPSPFLNDGSANAVNAFLQTLPKGSPLAVKVTGPISNATSNLIFNNPKYHVSYVFGDLEGSSADTKVKTLAQQVRFVNGQNNGTKTQSSNAYIGNFGFQDLPSDKTVPNGYGQSKGAASFSGWSQGAFNSAKLNMSMPEVYAGSPSFRNPAAGNSDAPNIRSALFILPALRVAQVKVNEKAGEQLVPYIARFNNWGNEALDSDRNPANGQLFQPGVAMPAKFGLPAVPASDTINQMLSRRDFAAQVAHYRLRGADSYLTFEQGVVGYINEDKRKDAKAGWTEPHIDATFKAADHKLLLGSETDYPGGDHTGSKDPNGNIVVDGKNKSDEAAGAMFSGVYSLSLKKLDVLFTNMDDDDHNLTLPDKIAGFDLKTKTFDVDSGSNLLVEYKLTTSGVNKGWAVALTNVPFTAIENSRNHFGVPEPTTATLLGLAGFFGLTPRRKRNRTKAAAKTAPTGLVGGNVL